MALDHEQMTDEYMDALDDDDVFDPVFSELIDQGKSPIEATALVDEIKDNIRAEQGRIFRILVEHFQAEAEIDGVADSGIAVTVDPNTGDGSTTEDGNLTGGIQ